MSEKIHSLIKPDDVAVVMIDHQPQMLFGVQSIDRQTLINNSAAFAKTAKIFDIPIVLTTVAAEGFSGPLIPQVQSVFPDIKPIDRTSMNAWDDENFRRAIEATGRKRIVIAALWTEVCLVMPVIEMIEAGYEIYIVTDASGGTSSEAHERSLARLIQAGAVPVVWLQVLLELQRDWARTDTYEAVMNIVKEHAGAYGAGVFYAESMLGEHATESGQAVAGSAQ